MPKMEMPKLSKTQTQMLRDLTEKGAIEANAYHWRAVAVVEREGFVRRKVTKDGDLVKLTALGRNVAKRLS